MKMLILVTVSVLATIVSIPAMRMLVGLSRLTRTNFQGKQIPCGFGFAVVIAMVPTYITMLLVRGVDLRVVLFGFTLTAFGTLGLLDDIYGTREAGGFLGHFGLLKKGRVSTGLIKAVVGGLLGLAVGGFVSGFRLTDTLINALLITLFANLLNLLDLRPGRAVSCYWIGMLVLLLVKHEKSQVWVSLLPTFLPTAVITTLDRSAKVMIGDAGSNALGALLGLSIACEASLVSKIIIIVLVSGIHAYSEVRSISRLIERHRALRSVDRLLGVR